MQPLRLLPPVTLLKRLALGLCWLAICLRGLADVPFEPARQDTLWQWSVEIAGFTSSETNAHPRAFLYIPPLCQTVRGVLIGQHNMLEEPILQHPAVRAALADANMAAIWVTPAFDPNFNFTKNPQTPALFQQMMDDLAATSGYAELSKAPVVWIGHSGMAEAPYYFAAWDTEHAKESGQPAEGEIPGAGDHHRDAIRAHHPAAVANLGAGRADIPHHAIKQTAEAAKQESNHGCTRMDTDF